MEKKRGGRMGMFVFLGAIILLGIVFWWWGGWQKTKRILFNLSAKTADSQLTTLAGKEGFLERLKEKTAVIFEKAVAVPGKIVSETAEDISQSALETTKKGASEVLQSVEEQFGLKPAEGINEKPLEMALLGVKNRVFLFVVEGRESDSAYTIDWGDGEKTSGTVTASEKKNVPHSWGKGGSYLVVGEIVNQNAQIRRFSIPVIIE